ncbi:MAG: TonB-dependent receptor, partial [Candidatus Eremiobacteraeota bacterium]|nr:TonB-dependent receptor [Candidatus Eremiobacteraeota bacterium]
MLLSQLRRTVGVMLAAAVVCVTLSTGTALAGTTGTISGTVTDASTGAPIVDATVAASSPTGSRTSTTDSKGFYVLQALGPDTYLVSVQAKGYESVSVTGVTVQQDLTASENLKLTKSLTTIANVSARSSGSMVKSGTTSDVYNVTGAQLNAIAGGNDLHKTLYQYIAAIPGVTGSGFPAQPRIQGGSAADIAYQFDGIPINERITGLFTTNLSNVGVGNVEVFTGGLSAEQSGGGLGIINTVVKTGTYPGIARATYGTSWQYSNQFETLEYGGATQDRKYSWYMSVDNTNSLNQFASGQTYPAFIIEQDNGPGVVKTTDLIANFHYRPNERNDFQVLAQNGLGEFIYSYLMRRAPGEPVPLTANACPGAQPDPAGLSWSGDVGGIAPSGQPCPIGLYFGAANTQNGGGNIWHHYSGLGKVQWTHIINDHSAFVAKIAENFNQYVFDQPVLDANLPQLENNNDFNVDSRCPQYPYAVGTPIYNTHYFNPTPNSGGVACDQLANWFSTGYYQDRRSNMYIGSVDYTNSINANATVKAGISYEYDKNL